MNTPTIIIVHQDIPGMIALVTGHFPAMVLCLLIDIARENR